MTLAARTSADIGPDGPDGAGAGGAGGACGGAEARVRWDAETVDALLDAWASGDASPSEVFWGAVYAEALSHVAAGRLVPVAGSTDAGGAADAAGSRGAPPAARWRLGPLDGPSLDRVDALADAMPLDTDGAGVGSTAGARAALVRGAMDAVADSLVRRAGQNVGAPRGVARGLVAAPGAGVPPVPDQLTDWAHDATALLDPRVTVSLRLEPLACAGVARTRRALPRVTDRRPRSTRRKAEGDRSPRRR